MNGLTLPTPPDNYWATMPWWGWLTFMVIVVLIVVTLTPWIIQRSRNALSATTSRENVITRREAALNARQDTERERLVDALDICRQKTIGWAAIAHPLWHDLRGAIHARNELLAWLHRVAEGKLTAEVLRQMMLGRELKPLPDPAPLPDVDAVEPKRPGDTKYA